MEHQVLLGVPHLEAARERACDGLQGQALGLRVQGDEGGQYLLRCQQWLSCTEGQGA